MDELTLKMEYIPTTDLHRLSEIERDSERIREWNEVFQSFIKKVQAKADEQHLVTYFRTNYFPGSLLLEVIL